MSDNILDENALTDDTVYLPERQYLLKRRDELGDIFDKGRVALAGGAIALSVTISKDVLTSMLVWQRIVLALGWISLTVALMCAVMAVYQAGLGYDRQVDILDCDRLAGLESTVPVDRNRDNLHLQYIETCNKASLFTLALGLVLGGIGLFSAFAMQPGKKVESNSSMTLINTLYDGTLNVR
jgi:hypothetical protein